MYVGLEFCYRLPNASTQFAFHTIDLQEAIREVSWRDSIAFRDRVSSRYALSNDSSDYIADSIEGYQYS